MDSRSPLTAVAAATSLLVCLTLVQGRAAQQALDVGAVAPLLSAASPEQAAGAVDQVVASGVSFDQAMAALKRGRAYSANVPRGVVAQTRLTGSGRFPYTIEVPQAYDPARSYQVRVHLHGGVGRPEPGGRGTGGIGSLAGVEQIYVLPEAWNEASWWSWSQIENLRGILDRVKRTYNVDENRIALSGHSDGATGDYYVAMRDTTPYASVLPLNGYILVLAEPSVGVREMLFPNNLRNKPFFIVNGGLDQLYPVSMVEPYVLHLQKGGVRMQYEPQPNGGHNTRWWPQLRDAFEGFVRANPRDPHPATLTWETDGTPGTTRAHWLVIDRLAPAGVERPLPDLNEYVIGQEPNFGVRASGMRVTQVMDVSSAAGVGLLPGDLVVSVNGRQLPEGAPLEDLLSIQDPGTPLTMIVERGGARLTLSGTYQPEMRPRVRPLFPRRGRSGRVDLVREGNTVRATTRGVEAFTLLLSPDAFDFSMPVSVIVDGRTRFNGRVERSLHTLLTWAARDNDRTMLYGAELPVTVR
jgi:hypothetical protein